MRVAIVGGGVMGACLAWRLAVRGHRVTLVEPGGVDARTGSPADFGHAGAASGDQSRIVRALYDSPVFAAFGHASLGLWDAFAEELHEPLVEKTGVLYLNDDSDAPKSLAFRSWVDRGIENLSKLGAAFEVLSPLEIHSRFPAIRAAGLARGVFEPLAGFARAALATRAFSRAAMATGLVEHVRGRALGIATRGGTATGIDIEGRTLEADWTVVAAGLSGAELVAPFIANLAIVRIPHWTSYFEVTSDAAESFRAPRLCSFIDLGAGLYGFPAEGKNGFKIAWHEPRRAPGTGHGGSEIPDAADLEAIRAAAELRFPGLRGARPIATFACAYDATPDENFRIGPVHDVEGLFFIGGMSGHGFKHAPAVSESVAALTTGDAPLLDLNPFALPI